MRRTIVTLAVLALLVSLPTTAMAQANDDPTTEGTTGLFTVPRANTVEQGRWSLGGYYTRVAREEGDSAISTLGFSGAYGLTDNLEIFVGATPRINIDRRFTAERDLFLAHLIPLGPGLVLQYPLSGTGINEHPFAIAGETSGFGDVWAGLKMKIAGDPYEYDGIAWLLSATFPTADTGSLGEGGVGTGKFSITTKLIGSVEAFDGAFGMNIFGGYTYRETPDQDELEFPLVRAIVGAPEFVLPSQYRWFVSPEVLYGIGFQIPTNAQVQLIAEWTGAVTVRDMDSAYTGGTDQSLLHIGLRASMDSGLALNAGLNYQTAIKVRDPAWQSSDVDGDLRRFGFLAGLSYSTSRREPLTYAGTAPMDLPAVNGPPTLTCRAERTTIRQGESVRLMATTNDPDGDSVTVQWSAAAGSLSAATGNEVTWNSTGVAAGSGNIAARADDGYGGTADCSVRVTVEEPPPPPQPTINEFVCTDFRSGSARIDNRCKAILDDVALQLRQNPGATATITGHSDTTGSADQNAAMSMERAANGKAYLVDTHGIDGSRIATDSKSSMEPMADNSTRAGQSTNRRIVIVVTIPPR